MKLRDMRRSEWMRIAEREYSERGFENNGARVRESLLLIKKVEEPLAVESLGKRTVIADAGYCWLQRAEEGGFVWLTAMFDGDGRFLQIYFDITAGNRFDDPENPTFEDMYLDVVLDSDGGIFVLDEDELEKALSVGDITDDEYRRTKGACARLCGWLEGHQYETEEYCRETYKSLLEKLSFSC